MMNLEFYREVARIMPLRNEENLAHIHLLYLVFILKRCVMLHYSVAQEIKYCSSPLKQNVFFH